MIKLFETIRGSRKKEWEAIGKLISSQKTHLAIPQIKHFLKTPDLSPEEMREAREQLAVLWSNLGESLQAYHEYRKLSTSWPKEPCYKKSLAEVLLRLKKSTEAEKIVAGLIKNHGPLPEYLALGGEIKRQKKDPSAEDLFKTAVAKDRKNAYAYFGLGRFYMERRKWNDAILNLERVVGNKEYRLLALFLLGESYFQMVNLVRSQEILELALGEVTRETPESLRARYVLSSLFESRKELGRAVEQWRIIADEDASYQDVLQKLKENARYSKDRMQDYETQSDIAFRAMTQRLITLLGAEPLHTELVSNEEVHTKVEQDVGGMLKETVLYVFLRDTGLKDSMIRQYAKKAGKDCKRTHVYTSGPISRASWDASRELGVEIHTRKELSLLLSRFEKQI